MVKDLVSILIPTRGRAKQLKKHIGLIRKNTYYIPYELLIMADEDDKASIRVCEELNLTPFIHSASENGRDFFVGKINKGFKESDAQYLIYFSDDVEVGSAWLMQALKCFNAHFPDDVGVLAFDDGFWRDKLAPHGLVSRKWIEEYQFGKWLLWPEYMHYHGDNEITRVAKKRNKFVYCPDSKAIHTRPEKFEKRDNVWWEMYDHCYTRDTEIFQQRVKQGLPGYGPTKN